MTLPAATATGVGGGGAVPITPFRFPRLTVGPLDRHDIVAVAGAFPPQLDHSYGVELGGALSHGFFTGHRVTIDFNTMQLVIDAEE